MQGYEVTLKNCDGKADETCPFVKFVAAPSKAAVVAWLKDNGLTDLVFGEPWERADPLPCDDYGQLADPAELFDEGFDVILHPDGYSILGRGIVPAEWEAQSVKAVKYSWPFKFEQ